MRGRLQRLSECGVCVVGLMLAGGCVAKCTLEIGEANMDPDDVVYVAVRSTYASGPSQRGVKRLCMYEFEMAAAEFEAAMQA